MRAAVVHGSGDIRVEARPVPEPGPGEVLIQVMAAGVCGSDAGVYAAVPESMPLDHEHPVTHHRGPLILGHEFAGEIVATGPLVPERRLGALCACGAGVSCGACRHCRQGRTNLCQSYFTLGWARDGGLAEFVAAPATICLDVDGLGLAADTAALAQPMAIAVHAVRRGRVATGDRVVVIGAGGIGVFAAFVAAQYGAEVTVLDLDSARLRVAAELGAAQTIAVGAGEALEPDFAADVVLEVSGSGGGFRNAAALIGRGTRVVTVGVQPPREVDLGALLFHEAELLGTVAHVCGEDLPEAVRLLARHAGSWADVAPVAITLEELVERGLRPILDREGGRIKTLIDPAATTARPARHSPCS